MPLKPKQAPPQRKCGHHRGGAPAPVVFVAVWALLRSSAAAALVDRRRPFGLAGVSSVIAAAASFFSSFDAACAGHLAKFQVPATATGQMHHVCVSIDARCKLAHEQQWADGTAWRRAPQPPSKIDSLYFFSESSQMVCPVAALTLAKHQPRRSLYGDAAPVA